MYLYDVPSAPGKSVHCVNLPFQLCVVDDAILFGTRLLSYEVKGQPSTGLRVHLITPGCLLWYGCSRWMAGRD